MNERGKGGGGSHGGEGGKLLKRLELVAVEGERVAVLANIAVGIEG
jgi:hypothetical protein